jgi:hypothetical protein
MKSRFGFLVALAIASVQVQALAPSDAPKETEHVLTSVSDANAAAGAIAGSVAGATSGSLATGGDSSATVGAVTANGGAGGAGGAGGNGGEARSDANSDASNRNVIDASTTVERSVGALIMGTVIPVDCGFGGQAGGANRNGSGFLGVSWTTDKCYTLKAATAWAAMGEYELACVMLVDVTKKALKRAKRSPDCTAIGATLRALHTNTPAAPTSPQTPVVIIGESLLPSVNAAPPAAYATEDFVREQVDRAFRKSVSK